MRGKVAQRHRAEVADLLAVNHGPRVRRVRAGLAEGASDQAEEVRPLVKIGATPPQPVYHRHLGHHDEGEARSVLGNVEGDLLVDPRESLHVGDVGGEGGREKFGKEAVGDDALGQL